MPFLRSVRLRPRCDAVFEDVDLREGLVVRQLEDIHQLLALLREACLVHLSRLET